MHGHDNDRPYAYRRGRSSAPDPNYPPFPSDAKAARNQYITILPRSLHHEDAIVVLQTSQRLAAAQWRQKEQSLRSLRPRRRQHRRWQQHLQSRRRCTAHSNRKQGACSAAAAAAVAAANRVFGAGRALASDAAALLLLPLPGDGAPLSVAAALLPPRVVHCQQRCPAMLLHWLGPSPKQHEPFGGQFCLESAWDIDPAGRLLVVGSMLRRPIRSSVLRQPLAAGCYPLRQRIRSRPADKFSADSQLLNLGSPLSAACRMCRVRPCKEHQQCVRANRGLRDERVVEGGWGCPGSNAWKVVCERVAFDFVPDKFGLRI